MSDYVIQNDAGAGDLCGGKVGRVGIFRSAWNFRASLS